MRLKFVPSQALQPNGFTNPCILFSGCAHLPLRGQYGGSERTPVSRLTVFSEQKDEHYQPLYDSTADLGLTDGDYNGSPAKNRGFFSYTP